MKIWHGFSWQMHCVINERDLSGNKRYPANRKYQNNRRDYLQTTFNFASEV